jgi:hypothetical protein
MTLEEHIINCLPHLCEEKIKKVIPDYGEVVLYKESLVYYSDGINYFVILTPKFKRLIDCLFGYGKYECLKNVDNIDAIRIYASKYDFSKFLRLMK